MLLNRLVLGLDVYSKSKFIRYTTWPLDPHKFLNNKDGSKTWVSDGNTKEEGDERL